MSAKYADIIIDISHEEVDKPFSYRVPKHLHGKLAVGSQVTVPFGKGNTMRTGFVVGFSEESQWPEDKVKFIEDISTKQMGTSGKLIALAAWIKENYGSTMINAINTVMPVKRPVRAVVKKTIYAHPEADLHKAAEAYQKKNAVARLRLVNALKEEGEVSAERARDVYKISSQTLSAMASEGVIIIEEDSVYRRTATYDYDKAFDISLNESQQAVVDRVSADMDEGLRGTYLLHGITGSGKTEVYVKLIKKVVAEGKQAIVLIPEISLTYQNVKYFRNYFGDRVTIINSKLSDGEKYDQLMRAKNGDVDVVIGPRSALFAPFENLGIIIIDEEHETSYKSDYSPKYHAREVALKRAELEGATVILGSATPSVESYNRALSGRYTLLELKERANAQAHLSETEIVDLRQELRAGNRSILSRSLCEHIADRLAKKEQIMLFINKRGYNSFVSCRSCGEAIRCPHCDVTMTKHNNNVLMCHYCGFTAPEPKACPNCGSNLIGGYGTGTQKVEEEVKKLFPSARVLRMDRDTTTTKNAHQQILNAFDKGQADILIGTQMIVKGHDFPRVTLVGIMLADLTLFSNDYRAGERTFDLITQAAGRAGRGELPGKVIIQTYKPEHYAIMAATAQSYDAFYSAESGFRALAKYPPECNMMVVLAAGNKEPQLEKRMTELHQAMCKTATREAGYAVIGPAAPTISKIKDIYRRVIYVKHANYHALVAVKDAIEEHVAAQNITDVAIQFDFNPLNMY